MCLTACDPMNCSTPRSFVLCYLPEFAQTHVHWVCDAIQLSHPLSLPSNPAFNLSQHHDLFQLIDSAGGNLQHQSFQWIFRVDLLSDCLVWPPCCSRDSRESSPAPQFKSINSWTLSLLYIWLSHLYLTTGKTIALTTGPTWMGYLLTEMLEGQDTGRKSHGTTGFSFPILSPFHKWSSHPWFIIKRIVF